MGVSVSKTRDSHGLLPQQRLLLQTLLTARSWKEAEEEAGIKPRTFNRWIREDGAFKNAYDKLFDDKGEAVRKEISYLAAKATATLEDAFEAKDNKTQKVQCPNCMAEFEVQLKQPNWNARMRAVEIATKVGGQLKDVKKIEGTVTHMSIEQQIALGMIKSGKESGVPPHVIEELKKLGFLDNNLDEPLDSNNMSEYLEPEFEEVDDEPRRPVSTEQPRLPARSKGGF